MLRNVKGIYAFLFTTSFFTCSFDPFPRALHAGWEIARLLPFLSFLVGALSGVGVGGFLGNSVRLCDALVFAAQVIARVCRFPRPLTLYALDLCRAGHGASLVLEVTVRVCSRSDYKLLHNLFFSTRLIAGVGLSPKDVVPYPLAAALCTLFFAGAVYRSVWLLAPFRIPPGDGVRLCNLLFSTHLVAFLL